VDEVIYYVVSFSLTIIGMLGVALYWLGGKFKEIEKRFEQIDERFNRVDERFRQVDEKIERTRVELKGYVDRVLAGFASYQEFFVEFLTAEGVVKRDRADLLKGELGRVLALAKANPLAEEEWRRLAELIEKEELTYEEALWLREIARRLIKEYGTPETWKLHIYASMWVALARKKESRQ